MAGGIDWFRWHHGSVTDPKFGLIAKKAGARVSDVIAVWVFILENASSESERGTVGELDFESIEHLLGLDEGQAGRILEAMSQRGLIDGDRITSWDKRQPKRERDTDSSAERTRAYRDRQKESSDATQNHVTPCDAKETLEESRGEEIKEEPTVLVGLASNPSSAVKPFRIPCPAEKLLEAFHASCPTLPRVMKLNDKRKTHLSARWREVDSDSKFSSSDDGIAVFRSIFDKVHASDFLAGRAKGWHATFDWLVESSTNFLKVCEGHYDNDRRAAK